MKIMRSVTTGLVLIGAVVGCRDNTGVDASRAVRYGYLSVPNQIIALGDTQRVTVTLLDSARQAIPLGAARGRVQLVSSNNSLATVTPAGLMTAVGVGNVQFRVMVDSVELSGPMSGGSIGVLVITPPRQLTVIATGNGDADLRWTATCNTGMGSHKLPEECAFGRPPCRVRAGRAVDSCVWDMGFGNYGAYYVGVTVSADSSTTVVQIREDGSVVLVPPQEFFPPSCFRVQCFLYPGILVGPALLRLRVMKR